MMRGPSDQLDHQNAADDQYQEQNADQFEPRFDEILDRCAVTIQQSSHNEEAPGAGNNGSDDENEEIKLRHAGCDGQQFVGNGRQALCQQNPGPILAESILESVKLPFQMVEV